MNEPIADPTQLAICPICQKPCPLEECVTDSRGRAMHKACYREGLINGREFL